MNDWTALEFWVEDLEDAKLEEMGIETDGYFVHGVFNNANGVAVIPQTDGQETILLYAQGQAMVVKRKDALDKLGVPKHLQIILEDEETRE